MMALASQRAARILAGARHEIDEFLDSSVLTLVDHELGSTGTRVQRPVPEPAPEADAGAPLLEVLELRGKVVALQAQVESLLSRAEAARDEDDICLVCHMWHKSRYGMIGCSVCREDIAHDALPYQPWTLDPAVDWMAAGMVKDRRTANVPYERGGGRLRKNGLGSRKVKKRRNAIGACVDAAPLRRGHRLVPVADKDIHRPDLRLSINKHRVAQAAHELVAYFEATDEPQFSVYDPDLFNAEATCMSEQACRYAVELTKDFDWTQTDVNRADDSAMRIHLTEVRQFRTTLVRELRILKARREMLELVRKGDYGNWADRRYDDRDHWRRDSGWHW
ncbi:unnamed protein product [Prorocentrum cordatum]|uniref:Uncharacterized protein n=1 Tax=Prorocentrum cordatum TaxID=2364126 RepID=A0ABN9XET4_9DINO|nr:unnamed protein product [Polarella glacialis]